MSLSLMFRKSPLHSGLHLSLPTAAAAAHTATPILAVRTPGRCKSQHSVFSRAFSRAFSTSPGENDVHELHELPSSCMLSVGVERYLNRVNKKYEHLKIELDKSIAGEIPAQLYCTVYALNPNLP